MNYQALIKDYTLFIGPSNMVKPNRTKPNRNRQYGVVLIYTI